MLFRLLSPTLFSPTLYLADVLRARTACPTVASESAVKIFQPKLCLIWIHYGVVPTVENGLSIIYEGGTALLVPRSGRFSDLFPQRKSVNVPLYVCTVVKFVPTSSCGG